MKKLAIHLTATIQLTTKKTTTTDLLVANSVSKSTKWKRSTVEPLITDTAGEFKVCPL
jgi:hypothetical protein